MKVHELLEELQNNVSFKEWRANCKQAYLVHIFFMDSEGGKIAQIGYYDPDKDVIISFDIADSIKMLTPEKPFRASEYKLKELKLEKVSIEFSEALEKARDIQEKKYPSEKPIKEMAVLQNIDVGQIYNITFVTQGFKTLNIKLNSDSGELVSDELVSLIQFPSK